MSITKNKESRASYLATLRTKVQEMSSPKGSSNNTRQNDDRYWKPEVDKAGSGSAIIRFLSAKTGNAFPFVQLHTHGFQDKETNKWFIDNCPSSLGGLPSDVCPVCADNNRLWNVDKLPQKESAAKQLASSRKRKLSYISNILVVNDPKHPENNGKVFLFKYGVKIFGKIKDMINPPEDFPDMTPLDPYDVEEGANFRLRQVKEDGFPNYDKSTFDGPSAIGDEDFITQVESQLHDLNSILDPKNFKPYEKLAERFKFVTGTAAAPATNSGGDSSVSKPSVSDGMDDEAPVAAPKAAATKTAAPKATGKTAKPKDAAPAADPTEDDDYFSKLAAQSASED